MFETAMFLELMEKLVAKCHRNSRDKGFWGGVINLPEKLALMHSEISEWLEAYRDGNPPCPKDIMVLDGGEPRRLSCYEEEAADILIRLCDLCGYLNIDLGRATLAKMEYNAKRPPMHGKKC